MTEKKVLIPGIGLRNGKAYDLADGKPMEEMTAESVFRRCGDNGGDLLFLADLSEDDADHDRTIGMIKEIAREVDTPIIAGGRVKRLEDVKKYLYAGAAAVFLNMDSEDNVDLIKEASSRFGSDKIYAYLPDPSCAGRAEEFLQLGASRLVLGEKWESSDAVRLMEKNLPVFLSFSRADAGRLSEVFPHPCVCGAVFPADSSQSLMSIKQQLKKDGIPVETLESSMEWSQFCLNSDGLLPVIVQDYKTGQVLMLAYMNEEAFHLTLERGVMTYFSRSRQTLWMKGETSGHYQYVKSLSIDCDNDTLLAKVHQIGAACHTGNYSCFYQTLASKEYRETNPLKVFEEVFGVIQDRKIHPKEGSYTNYLFDKGIDKILKKCGEEATEIIIAAKNPDPEEIKYEISDFLYHVMVLMVEKGITWEEITRELANR